MKEIHEEPPKSQANKQIKEQDDMEYILVQVTQNDINAGDDKGARMMRDGWVKVDTKAEPDKDTGTPGYFYMKKDRRLIAEARQKRKDFYVNQMRAPLGAGSMPGGSAIREVVAQRDNEQLDPSEQAALSAAAVAANS